MKQIARFLILMMFAVGLTTLISWGLMDHSRKSGWMLVPYRVRHHGELHRVLSHAFVHADWMHLLFNMYVLYEFGQTVALELAGTALGGFWGGLWVAVGEPFCWGVLPESVKACSKTLANISFLFMCLLHFKVQWIPQNPLKSVLGTQLWRPLWTSGSLWGPKRDV